MRQVFSDADIPPQQRLKPFQDRIRRAQWGELHALHDDLSLNAVSHAIGKSVLTKTAGRNLLLERTSRFVAVADDDCATFCFGGAGNISLAQAGRETALLSGTIAAYDGTQPFKLSSGADDAPYYMLYVPKTALGTRARLIENYSAIGFGSNDPVQSVVSDFTLSIFRGAESGLEDAVVQLLINQAVDLMLLVIERGNGHARRWAPSAYKLALLRRLKVYIEHHLRSPHLSIASAARFLGISERYINILMNIEDTSFARYILMRRLENSYAEIRDGVESSKQIAEIAYDWGFVSHAHFSRVFRDRYGISPREWRLASIASRSTDRRPAPF